MFQLKKVPVEWQNYKAAMKESIAKRDWKKPVDWGHFFVDVIREAYRHMGYTLAHITAFIVVLIVLGFIF